MTRAASCGPPFAIAIERGMVAKARPRPYRRFHYNSQTITLDLCCLPRAHEIGAQACALAHELALHFVDGDLTRQRAAPRRERRAYAGRLAGRHDDRHDAIRRMRFVRARDAAPGDDQAVGVARQEAAHRDVVRFAGRQALQHRARAGGIVDVDRISAARDRVVELARREYVLGGELIVAQDPARLAHADLYAALRDVRLLESGHVAAQELGDLPHLTAARPLGERQVPDVGPQYPRDARAVDAHFLFVRGSEEQDVLARQPQLARLARLAHQVPQPVHAAPLLRMLLDIR